MFKGAIEWVKNMIRGSGMERINRKKVLEFMENTWDDVKCPVCKHSDWHVSAKVFCLKELDGNSNILWEQSGVIPVIPVTCGKCGNTILINAYTTGLLER